jgi:ribitol 2-dehydrogenase
MSNAEPGRVAVITGASSGIGRACAIAMDAAGMRLVIVGRDRARLEAIVPALVQEPVIVAGDVADAETSAQARDAALASFGRLDVLLANAGLYLPERGWEVPPERVSTIVTTNVLGVMHSVHAVLPTFIEQGIGDIVVTSSVSGHQVIPWEPIYSATKHAVQTFVHGTRQQLIGTGVRLGAIAPGIVLNELWGVNAGDRSIEEEVAAGRGIRSEDVADAVLYMLRQPRHVTIRDLVMLPTNQEI